MRIATKDLGEWVYPFYFEATPEELELPQDETRFSHPVVVDGSLSAAGGKWVVQARVATRATYECSRCLTIFEEEIVGDMAVLYEKSAGAPPDEADALAVSGDIVLLPLDAGEIDISDRVEEAIVLAIPMKPLCREDCRGLCPKCGIDLNQDRCNCTAEEVDTRWVALRKLIKEE